MTTRIAERVCVASVYHVVRGDRLACGAKRLLDMVLDRMDAHDVTTGQRCQRIGCQNDYAKADQEAGR